MENVGYTLMAAFAAWGAWQYRDVIGSALTKLTSRASVPAGEASRESAIASAVTLCDYLRDNGNPGAASEIAALIPKIVMVEKKP